MSEPGAQVPQGDEPAADPPWLTPGVAGIGTASFLADLGHEVPTALLPSLLTSTLGAPAAALGLIEGIADGLAGATRFAGGPLADDPARRRTVAVGGYTTTAVLSAAVGSAMSVWQVGVLRAGAWAARGLRVPARNALLADVVRPDKYGAAYGFERAADNAGAVAGPMLALAHVGAVGTRWAITLSVVPGLLATAAIVYAIRKAPRLAERPRRPLRVHVRPVLRGRLGRLMAGITLFEVGNVAATLFILRAIDQLRPDLGTDDATRVALLLYTGYNLVATLVSVPAGRLSDRLGRDGPRRVLLGGVAAFGLAYAALAADLTSAWLLLVPFALAGLGIGCMETAEHAAVAAEAPDHIRGSAFGLLAAVQSFGNFVASAVAGLLWTAVSPTVAFGYLTAWMLVALGGLLAARVH
jgi:MFS family permease